MDWFPLLNSLRVASVATVITFLLGIWTANGITRLPRVLKGVLDCILTLPLVLPPTVVGFFLLKTISPKAALGAFVLDSFGWKLTMTWYSAIFATTIVAFPLMYRTARGAFEQLSPEWEACAATMGIIPEGAYRNREFAEEKSDLGNTPLEVADVLFDPQTSGGMLIAVAPKDADQVYEALLHAVPSAQRIGEVIEKKEKYIILCE